jgi:hypothetical protein
MILPLTGCKSSALLLGLFRLGRFLEITSSKFNVNNLARALAVFVVLVPRPHMQVVFPPKLT